MPVIVLYQSFAVSFKWLFIWSLWWIIPLISLIHLNYVIKKYIHCLRNPDKYFKITLQDTDFSLAEKKMIDTKKLTNSDSRKWYQKLYDDINATEPEHVKHVALEEHQLHQNIHKTLMFL